jgi:hypothetical protein
MGGRVGYRTLISRVMWGRAFAPKSEFRLTVRHLSDSDVAAEI